MAGRTRAAAQGVISVYVTLSTRQGDVRPGQRESGSRVVESGASPGRGAVATLTSLGQRSLHVVGIGGALVVLQVARDAGGVGQVVISIDVALRTLQRDVRACEREAGLSVIEGRVCP